MPLFPRADPDLFHDVLNDSGSREAPGCPPPGKRPGEGDVLATSAVTRVVLRVLSSGSVFGSAYAARESDKVESNPQGPRIHFHWSADEHRLVIGHSQLEECPS